MKKGMLLLLLCMQAMTALGQEHTRLDFAKTYFEVGGSYFPSFTGQRLSDNESIAFEHPASMNAMLYWGGFHFWGHGEFYVSFPLYQHQLSPNETTDYALTHAAVTGARFLPWAFREKKLRPYVGLSWSALDFKQIVKPADDQPVYQKNFVWVPDAGVLYGVGPVAARLGVSYYPDHTWDYALSRTHAETIKTPSFSVQFGIIYAMERSTSSNPATTERWNSYGTFSRLGSHASRRGNFFIGAGPSNSFSLAASEYNTDEFAFLNEKQASDPYFDLALGYQLNKAGVFAAFSFRNPRFENAAYGVTQTIQKTSLAFEVNKFLFDFTGFAPYVGLNVAYDRVEYDEEDALGHTALTATKINPGLTFGWDILPGKTDEFLILRTNLRWYPNAFFEVEGKRFAFSQLEYNLIQAVFYPERLLARRGR